MASSAPMFCYADSMLSSTCAYPRRVRAFLDRRGRLVFTVSWRSSPHVTHRDSLFLRPVLAQARAAAPDSSASTARRRTVDRTRHSDFSFVDRRLSLQVLDFGLSARPARSSRRPLRPRSAPDEESLPDAMVSIGCRLDPLPSKRARRPMTRGVLRRRKQGDLRLRSSRSGGARRARHRGAGTLT